MKSFNFPTPITFGIGARLTVGAHLKALQKTRPLVVTDEAYSLLPTFQEFTEHLKKEKLTPSVFNDVRGNPVASSVEKGVGVFKSGQHDSIVGIGGGAALDVAKAIGVRAVHEGTILDYAWGAKSAIKNPLPHLVALPTTAGTGSEVGRSSVISSDKTKVKSIIFSPLMMPRHVFVDPELTESLPANITAATGMDALTHLIESYLCPDYHPMCDGIALEGVRLVSDNLVDCVAFSQKPPKNRERHLEARGHMMMAALMGAVAFQKDLGVNHSCAHALSTVCDLHHGLANALMLPHTLKFNAKVGKRRYKDLAWAASAPKGDLIGWVKKLNQSIGIPKHLKNVGVKKQHLDDLVKIAMADGCHKTNIQPVSEKDFYHLFKKALD